MRTCHGTTPMHVVPSSSCMLRYDSNVRRTFFLPPLPSSPACSRTICILKHRLQCASHPPLPAQLHPLDPEVLHACVVFPWNLYLEPMTTITVGMHHTLWRSSHELYSLGFLAKKNMQPDPQCYGLRGMSRPSSAKK